MRGGRVALAIELSQREGSVALGVGDEQPTVLRFDAAGSREADPLLPAIDRLLRDAGHERREIGLVAVSIGPGGFTGLRVAVTAARFLAEALDADLVAIPSALVAAAGARAPGPWLVAAATKRDTVWATMVNSDDGDPRIDGEPALRAASDVRFASARTLLADEHAPPSLLGRAQEAGLTTEPPRFDAADCLRIGRGRAAAGERVDPLRLASIYPREPEAVTLWNARHPA